MVLKNLIKKSISILILSLVLLLSINIVFAKDSSFTMFITPIKGTILEDESAEYNITIINDAEVEQSFITPYTSDADWVLTTEPQISRVPAKTAMTYKLTVDPKTNVAPGQYAITLNLKSTTTDETQKEMFLIFIRPLNPLPIGYVKSIALSVDMPINIDPRNDIPISVYLRNRNARDYADLRVNIESKLINSVYDLNFTAVEERTDKLRFKLDAYTEPQDDKLTVTLFDGNETINQVKVPIKVIQYTDIKEVRDDSESFLKKKITIQLTNFGNINNVEPYKYELSFFEDLFTKTTPEDTYVIKDSKRYLAFPKNIAPGDTTTIEITTNYRIIFYIIIIFIILITVYFQMRSPVIVKKEAHAHEQSQDGVSDFKVKILIKNRSQKPVENVKVIELIPSLASLIKEASIGTIEPTKVMRNDKSGTLVRWDINYLEPFEERIVTYKLRSKLNIIGGLTLQATKVKFETITGRERVTYSKKHTIKLLH